MEPAWDAQKTHWEMCGPAFIPTRAAIESGAASCPNPNEGYHGLSMKWGRPLQSSGIAAPESSFRETVGTPSASVVKLPVAVPSVLSPFRRVASPKLTECTLDDVRKDPRKGLGWTAPGHHIDHLIMDCLRIE